MDTVAGLQVDLMHAIFHGTDCGDRTIPLIQAPTTKEDSTKILFGKIAGT
jgi:hypothetical protein